MDGYKIGFETSGGDGVKLIFQRARHIGYRSFLADLQQYRSMLGNIGLWEFKVRYGLAPLPWWMKPEGAPITDPRRLLTAGKPKYFIGWDTADSHSVEVRESYMRPTPEHPMGSYKLEVGGKIITACGAFAQEGIPDSLYWHGGPPFVMYTELADWPWKEEEVDDGFHV